MHRDLKGNGGSSIRALVEEVLYEDKSTLAPFCIPWFGAKVDRRSINLKTTSLIGFILHHQQLSHKSQLLQ